MCIYTCMYKHTHTHIYICVCVSMNIYIYYMCVCACGLFNGESCRFLAQDRKIGDQKNAATRQRLWFSVFQNQACERFFRERISAMGISSCNLYNMTPAHTTCGHEPSWSSLSGAWDLEPSTCVKISHADQVKVLQTSALHVPLILHGHSWCRKDPTGLKPGSGKIVFWQAPQQLPHQSLCCPARTAKKNLDAVKILSLEKLLNNPSWWPGAHHHLTICNENVAMFPLLEHRPIDILGLVTSIHLQ